MRLTDEEVRQTVRPKNGQTIDHIAHYERHTKVRILTPNEKKHKKCVQLHKDGSEIKWTKPQYEGPIPLYGIDSLKEGQPVFYVEGEKKVQVLRDLGLAAVTAGGANEVEGADFSPLEGFSVRIWPDNDKAGHQAAEVVAKKCYAVKATPLKLTVRQGPKHDVVDYLRENPITGAGEILALPAKMIPEHIDGIPILSIEQLYESDIEPPEPIMGNIFTLSSLNMIFAQAGVGKTWLSLSMGMCLSFGKRFWGYEVPKKRRVLYIDGEMPEGWMKKRVVSLLHGIGQGREGEFYYVGVDRFTHRPLLNLANGGDQASIINIVRSKKIEVIFFDNLSCLVSTEAEENSQESWSEVQRFFIQLRVLGCCVMIIHHANKNGQQRGTNKKVDQLDNNINLERVDSGRGGAHFRVTFEKARHAQEGEAECQEAKLIGKDGGLWWLTVDTEKSNEDRAFELLRQDPATLRNAKELQVQLGISRATSFRLIAKAKEKGILGQSQQSHTPNFETPRETTPKTPQNPKHPNDLDPFDDGIDF